MLNVASEASANFPRERMRKELSRMGSVIGDSASYDYSALFFGGDRANFDRSWEIFTDVALLLVHERGCSAGAGAHRRQLRDDATSLIRICSVCRNASLMWSSLS